MAAPYQGIPQNPYSGVTLSDASSSSSTVEPVQRVAQEALAGSKPSSEGSTWRAHIDSAASGMDRLGARLEALFMSKLKESSTTRAASPIAHLLTLMVANSEGSHGKCTLDIPTLTTAIESLPKHVRDHLEGAIYWDAVEGAGRKQIESCTDASSDEVDMSQETVRRIGQPLIHDIELSDGRRVPYGKYTLENNPEVLNENPDILLDALLSLLQAALENKDTVTLEHMTSEMKSSQIFVDVLCASAYEKKASSVFDLVAQHNPSPELLGYILTTAFLDRNEEMVEKILTLKPRFPEEIHTDMWLACYREPDSWAIDTIDKKCFAESEFLDENKPLTHVLVALAKSLGLQIEAKVSTDEASFTAALNELPKGILDKIKGAIYWRAVKEAGETHLRAEARASETAPDVSEENILRVGQEHVHDVDGVPYGEHTLSKNPFILADDMSTLLGRPVLEFLEESLQKGSNPEGERLLHEITSHPGLIDLFFTGALFCGSDSVKDALLPHSPDASCYGHALKVLLESGKTEQFMKTLSLTPDLPQEEVDALLSFPFQDSHTEMASALHEAGFTISRDGVLEAIFQNRRNRKFSLTPLVRHELLPAKIHADAFLKACKYNSVHDRFNGSARSAWTFRYLSLLLHSRELPLTVWAQGAQYMRGYSNPTSTIFMTNFLTQSGLFGSNMVRLPGTHIALSRVDSTIRTGLKNTVPLYTDPVAFFLYKVSQSYGVKLQTGTIQRTYAQLPEAVQNHIEGAAYWHAVEDAGKKQLDLLTSSGEAVDMSKENIRRVGQEAIHDVEGVPFGKYEISRLLESTDEGDTFDRIIFSGIVSACEHALESGDTTLIEDITSTQATAAYVFNAALREQKIEVCRAIIEKKELPPEFLGRMVYVRAAWNDEYAVAFLLSTYAKDLPQDIIDDTLKCIIRHSDISSAVLSSLKGHGWRISAPELSRMVYMRANNRWDFDEQAGEYYTPLDRVTEHGFLPEEE